MFIPDFVWLATGGMHGCFNSEAMQVLKEREVILFPDLKATEEWRQRLPMLETICRRVTCSDLLEKMATDEQRSRGLDIADFLLMEDTPQMILARMIQRNPALPDLHRHLRTRTGGCRKNGMKEEQWTACCPVKMGL